MSDSAFKTAWKIRTLQPLFPSDLWCKCGHEIDPLGYHFYVCKAKNIQAKVRGESHYALKSALIDIGDSYFKAQDVKAAREEPHMKDYFPLKTPDFRRNQRNQPISIEDPDSMFSNPMGPNRRADIAFKPSSGDDLTLLVDVTTISPLIKQCKRYIPIHLADTATKRKTTDYNKCFSTISTPTASLWFFAIETNGVLSKEARKFCHIMADITGTPNVIQTIYQRLSVAIQTSIAKQIYKALSLYTSTDRNITNAHHHCVFVVSSCV
jgi:hypothetical protein